VGFTTQPQPLNNPTLTVPQHTYNQATQYTSTLHQQTSTTESQAKQRSPNKKTSLKQTNNQNTYTQLKIGRVKSPEDKPMTKEEKTRQLRDEIGEDPRGGPTRVRDGTTQRDTREEGRTQAQAYDRKPSLSHAEREKRAPRLW
jgi:hypothetical protein